MEAVGPPSVERERAEADDAPYPCEAHRRAVRAFGLDASMSCREPCWDNALAESFLVSLKGERLHKRHFSTVQDVQDEVDDGIERFDTRERRHPTLSHISPVIDELRHAA